MTDYEKSKPFYTFDLSSFSTWTKLTSTVITFRFTKLSGSPSTILHLLVNNPLFTDRAILLPCNHVAVKGCYISEPLIIIK
jgi:hypothetical protein